jgi:hypothetical protein
LDKIDLRKSLLKELSFYIKNKKIHEKAIRIGRPDNGETIKLNGLVLYKILRTPNPWRKRGIVVYKKITDSAIERIGGKRSNDKKEWVGCALTEENYEIILRILKSIIDKMEIIKPIKKEKEKKNGRNS